MIEWSYDLDYIDTAHNLQVILQVMNLIQRIDVTTLGFCPKPLTNQYYSKDLATYTEVSDSTNIFPKTIALRGVNLYYTEKYHFVLY